MTKKHKAKTATARATARRRSVFPPHLQSTPDEWRALKRQEWLEVVHALARFRYGSAYIPAKAQFWNLSILETQITEAMAGEWVAW